MNAPRKTPRPSGPPQRSARRRARELVVMGLYQWRVAGADEAAIEAHLGEDDELREEFKRADRELFQSLLRGVLANPRFLVELVAPFVDRDFSELSPIEAGILLLGAHELADHPETPYRVVINEAIELAKTFGGTDGHKYVNGVLDKLAAKVRSVEIEGQQQG